MATATLEPVRTDRRHPAAGRGASPGLRVPAAAGAAGHVSPARRPAPPIAAGHRAATRSGALAQARRRRAALALLVIVLAVLALVLRGGGVAGAESSLGDADAAGAAGAGDAAVGAGAAATASWAASGEAESPVLVVGAGETVWGLVSPHVPAGMDRGVYVTQVLRHNGLRATAVVPGTVVRLP